MTEAKLKEKIEGAVARGWCSKENEHKTMDSDLAIAISNEVLALLSQLRQDTIREAIDSLDEVYYSANVANSVLSEMDRVEIKSNNDAVRRCIEILEFLSKLTTQSERGKEK